MVHGRNNVCIPKDSSILSAGSFVETGGELAGLSVILIIVNNAKKYKIKKLDPN
jgi:hypothetical protein